MEGPSLARAEIHGLPVPAADHLGQCGLADLPGSGKKHHLLDQILIDRCLQIPFSLVRHGSPPIDLMR